MTIEYAIERLTGGDLEQIGDIDSLWRQEGAHDDDSFEFMPTKIVIASSGAKAFQVGEDSIIKAPLKAHVIDSVRIRSYYPSRTGSKVPMCSSVGAKYGVFNRFASDEEFAAASGFNPPHPAIEALANNGDIEDFYTCRGCPLSEFGSALENNGQACKIKQRLLILPEGWSTPAILVLPTMSVSHWNRFCSTLQSVHRRPFYAFKIAFNIEKVENSDGQPYGVVKPEIIAPIDDLDDGKAVIELQRAFREYVRNRPVDKDEDLDEKIVEGAVI